MAANCFKLALLSTVIFSRFSSSPLLPAFLVPPSAVPWHSPPPTSAPSAASTLRSHGYTHMARILDYASASGGRLAGWNDSGTLFAPSDSAFRNLRSRHPYATPSILLYHTAPMPALLFADIAAMPTGSSLPTLALRRRCLFLRQIQAGELCVAETPFRRSQSCVKIRDPDLFHDGDLAIHGIDGVLDPSTAAPCPLDAWRRAPHLDSAMTALRRKGYFAVAEALRVRRSELVRLPSVTVFAPRDVDVDVQGFREALGHHVVPRGYDLHDLARLSLGQRIRTIAPSREIAVGSDAEGAVTVDSISNNGEAIYRNRWAVILPVRRQLGGFDASLDSFGEPLESGARAALTPSMYNLKESSEGEHSSTGDGVRSDNNPTTHGRDPAVILPDAWCQLNVTPVERNVSPSTAMNSAPVAAIIPFSDL